ncbi:MAG TPA: dolichyl-phosphate beta-glucosyltransferase [Candidatus Binatia bacterium]|nr:dolichyl-phosphate beta-glucosyltransferase [Candidatus Binatia bacterium]
MIRQQERDAVYLSLIIPAFNEEERIGTSLEQILRFLKSQPHSFEVIIIDDGSSDGTRPFVHERYGKEPRVRLYSQPARRGKGAAVQLGMLKARGDYVFFSDADLSVSIEQLPLFMSRLQDHCDAAIGTRQTIGARIEVRQPRLREWMGQVFTWLSNLFLGLRHSDLTCGFKGFRRPVANELFSRQQLHNWSFDSEILYLAKIRGYRVAEVPVTWRNDAASKVKLSRDVISSFLGLLSIRLNHYLGRYN